MGLKILIPPTKWTPAEVRAHADYLVQNTLKALDDVPMHGKRRQHIERNLLNLRRLATKGQCSVHTDDQTRFVNRKLNKTA